MRVFLFLFLVLSSPLFAEIGDDCPKRIAAPLSGKLVNRLARIFRIPDRQWDLLEGEGEPILVVGGLDEAALKDAAETARQMNEIIGMAREGKIRGFGFYSVAETVRPIVLWGQLFALALSGTFFIPEDAHYLVGLLVKAVAGFSALRTLRWMRTLDDALAREGHPESNLWSALGPIQGPLQYWLKETYRAGIINVVVYFARESLPVLRDAYRKTRALPEGAVRVVLAPSR